MRVLLWVLLLLVVFAGVSLYHTRFTAEAREQRAAAQGQAAIDRPLPDGFQARVVIGDQSSAPRVEGLRPAASPPSRVPQGPRAAPPVPKSAGSHVVKRGESLSTICERHYGTSKPDLVLAVAKWNGLRSPNALREGQELTLPSPAELGLAPR